MESAPSVIGAFRHPPFFSLRYRPNPQVFTWLVACISCSSVRTSKGEGKMTDGIDRTSDGRQGTPGWMFAAVAVLGVVALVGLVLAHNASTQAQEIQQTMDNKVKAIQTIQQDLTNQIA